MSNVSTRDKLVYYSREIEINISLGKQCLEKVFSEFLKKHSIINSIWYSDDGFCLRLTEEKVIEFCREINGSEGVSFDADNDFYDYCYGYMLKTYVKNLSDERKKMLEDFNELKENLKEIELSDFLGNFRYFDYSLEDGFYIASSKY